MIKLNKRIEELSNSLKDLLNRRELILQNLREMEQEILRLDGAIRELKLLEEKKEDKEEVKEET